MFFLGGEGPRGGSQLGPPAAAPEREVEYGAGMAPQARGGEGAPPGGGRAGARGPGGKKRAPGPGGGGGGLTPPPPPRSFPPQKKTLLAMISVILSGGMKMRDEHGMLRGEYIYGHVFSHNFMWE